MTAHTHLNGDTAMSSDHLSSPDSCTRAQCAADCPHTISQNPATGRWFITMGHAGFNSPANNRSGYVSQAAALAAHRRYAGRGALAVGAR